jgi:hypothetical protein
MTKITTTIIIIVVEDVEESDLPSSGGFEEAPRKLVSAPKHGRNARASSWVP